jgi:hypothetical protein
MPHPRIVSVLAGVAIATTILAGCSSAETPKPPQSEAPEATPEPEAVVPELSDAVAEPGTFSPPVDGTGWGYDQIYGASGAGCPLLNVDDLLIEILKTPYLESETFTSDGGVECSYGYRADGDATDFSVLLIFAPSALDWSAGCPVYDAESPYGNPGQISATVCQYSTPFVATESRDGAHQLIAEFTFGVDQYPTLLSARSMWAYGQQIATQVLASPDVWGTFF